MGTEVLRSHDCVRYRLTPDADTFRSSPQSKPCRRAFPNPARNGRRKRRCKCNADFGPMVLKISSANLVMEKVKILKRGEDFKPSSPPKDLRSEGGCDVALKDSVISSTDKSKSGPDPDLVPKQIRPAHSQSDDEVYAGSAFFSSPSPSSLPIPRFCKKRSIPSNNAQRSCSETSMLSTAP